MDPQLQVEITSAVCSSVAIASTLQRMFIRLRGPGLGLDDGWAIFSTLALIVQVAAVFTHVPNPPGTIGVARYYMMSGGFYMVIWGARLSILCSLIRLEPFPARQRRWRAVGILFIAFWIGLLVQLFWECESETGWKQRDSPQCKLGKDVAIFQLVTDIIADCLLLWIPARLFRSIMSKNLRRRLIVIFSTCIMTTIVSLVHAAFIITSGGTREVVAALTEDCVSLLVCNLPLCAAQIFRQGKWFEDEDPISTSMWPSWLRKTITTTSGTGSSRLSTTAGGRTVVSVALPTQADHLDPEGYGTESHSMKDFASRSGNKIGHD